MGNNKSRARRKITQQNELVAASGKGDLRRVKQLLNASVKVNSKDEDDNTALITAAQTGETKVLQCLLKAKADVLALDVDGNTALIWTAEHGPAYMLQMLVEHGANVNAKNNNGQTALIRAAQKESHYSEEEVGIKTDGPVSPSSLVEYLLKAGADVNAFNHDGYTALHIAAFQGHTFVVNKLIAANAGLNAKADKQQTPLLLAAGNGHSSICEILIEESADCNAADERGQTPLMVAAANGHTYIAEKLLRAGCDGTMKDTLYGANALSWAVELRRNSLVQLLVEQKGDVNSKNYQGETLLSKACTQGATDIVSYLVEQSADINATVHGKSLWKLADNPDVQQAIKTGLEKRQQRESLAAADHAAVAGPGAASASPSKSEKPSRSPSHVVPQGPSIPPVSISTGPRTAPYPHVEGTAPYQEIPDDEKTSHNSAHPRHEFNNSFHSLGIITDAKRPISAPLPSDDLIHNTIPHTSSTPSIPGPTPGYRSQSAPHNLREQMSSSSLNFVDGYDPRLPPNVAFWKKRHVNIWLTQIELQQYTSNFNEASIDGEMLLALQIAEDNGEGLLEEQVGVSRKIHRMKICKEIRKLRSAHENWQQANLEHKAFEVHVPTPREIPFSEIEIREKIGEGTFGTVYLAIWRGSEVAVKMLHEQSLQGDQLREFIREAGLMELVCNHLHIVKFYGACSVPPNMCIVLEYLPNGSVKQLLQSARLAGTPIDISTKIRMVIGAASGVLHLHAEGVIHRDLAARNLLVDLDMKVRVTDFGMSRLKLSGKSVGHTESQIGPVKWMSPESISSQEYSEASDSFSFGVCLWEIFYEKEPFEDRNNLDVLFKVVNENLRLPVSSDCPKPLKELMLDCWSENSPKRPKFTEIVNRLLQFSQELDAKQQNTFPSNTNCSIQS